MLQITDVPKFGRKLPIASLLVAAIVVFWINRDDDEAYVAARRDHFNKFNCTNVTEHYQCIQAGWQTYELRRVSAVLVFSGFLLCYNYLQEWWRYKPTVCQRLSVLI